MRSSNPTRKRVMFALALTILLGLASRLYPLGWHVYDKSLGDALYAVAVYLALALLFRRSPWLTGLIAFLLCVAIETFKLTGIPAALAHVPVVPWLLGHTFSWHNLVCYLLGVLLIAGLDAAWLRRRRETALDPPPARR